MRAGGSWTLTGAQSGCLQPGCLSVPPALAEGPGPRMGLSRPTWGRGWGAGGCTCCSRWACGCRAPRRWSRPRSSPRSSPADLPRASAGPTAPPPRFWCSGTRGRGQEPRVPLQRQACRPSGIRVWEPRRRPAAPSSAGPGASVRFGQRGQCREGGPGGAGQSSRSVPKCQPGSPRKNPHHRLPPPPALVQTLQGAPPLTHALS